MTTQAHRAVVLAAAGGRRRRGHFGAWRAVAALPSVVGGVLLMFVVTGGLGAWQGPVLLLWLSAGVAVCSRPGERLVVRAIGFRRLSKGQWAVLGPVIKAAVARCGGPARQIDWYVRAGGQPNACVLGRRSVAVTDGALQGFLAGRLTHDQFVAVLLHEVGHRVTNATSFCLATWWLASPGRVGFRLVLAAAMALSGQRRLGWGSRMVAVVAGGIAGFQAVEHGQGVATVMLTGLAAALVGTPVADAAMSRAAERAADRFAASVGAGADLASALVAMGANSPAASRWGLRLLDGHPSTTSRIEALTCCPEPPRSSR